MNPINSLATKNNKVTVFFSKLLHELWNNKRTGGYGDVFRPEGLKNAIATHNALFKGFS